MRYTAILSIILLSTISFRVSSADDDCIYLMDCEAGIKHTYRRTDPASIRILQSAHCGYEHGEAMVICKNIPDIDVPSVRNILDTTGPTKDQSECVYLDECPDAMTLIQFRKEDPEVKTLLRSAHCDSPGRRAKTRCSRISAYLKRNDPTFASKLKLLPKYETDECGLEYSETKIVGGVTTELDEFPWVALLRYKTGIKFRYACHGSVISKKYILTAAHCLDSHARVVAGDLYSVVLGEYDTKNVTDCFYYNNDKVCSDPPKEYLAQYFTIHDDYLNGSPDSDIALIRLKDKINYTDFIRPICLPPVHIELRIQEKLWVSGWGRTEKEKMSRVKLKAEIPYVAGALCLTRLSGRSYPRNICAGAGDGVDTCKGDSGGPLMVQKTYDTNVNYFVVGVVSRGPECGTGPAIYTRVTSFLDWIIDTIEE